jgi:hypothetical protein
MKTLYLPLFIFVTSLILSKQNHNNPVQPIPQTDTVLLKLKSKKDAIDQYISRHNKDLIILVKVPGKEKPVIVKNEHWPEEIEYTYNVLRNPAGEIIFIAQIPFSESGDWDIIYKHYFDEQGHVFAFSKQESIFDDGVKGGVVREILLNYYNKNFKKISQSNKLTDKDYRSTKTNKNLYDFLYYKYQNYKKLYEFLMGYHIQLTN